MTNTIYRTEDPTLETTELGAVYSGIIPARRRALEPLQDRRPLWCRLH